MQRNLTQIDMTAAKVVADIEAHFNFTTFMRYMDKLSLQAQGHILLRNYHAFKHGEITDKSH